MLAYTSVDGRIITAGDLGKMVCGWYIKSQTSEYLIDIRHPLFRILGFDDPRRRTENITASGHFFYLSDSLAR